MRQKIIELLSNSNGLSAKQIHQRLQRQFSIVTTYQATHKTLKQMLVENVLLKIGANYSLNPKWIENFKKNAEALAEKVHSGRNEIRLEDMKEGDLVHLSFNGILDVGWFLIDKLMNAPNPKKRPCLALWRFCYSIVGLEEKHLTGLQKALTKNEWFAFVEEDNKVDRMFGDTLLSYGFRKIKYGVKCATPLSDKQIIGDYIADVIYPSHFRKLWAAQNRLPVKIAQFNLGRHLFAMREMQPKIEVIVARNGKLADEYRNEYIVRKV